MIRLIVIGAILAFVAASPADAQAPPPEIVAPASRDVTPPGVTPGPSRGGLLVREPAPPRPPDPPRWRRFFLPETTDAATFVAGDRTIKISGIAAPLRQATCQPSDGAAWPCGRTALHALRMFLRGRAIECFFPYADTAVEITAPCRVGKSDLGLWLLAQGWAKPGQYATDDYRQAADGARCAGRGLWRGVDSNGGDCRNPE